MIARLRYYKGPVPGSPGNGRSPRCWWAPSCQIKQYVDYFFPNYDEACLMTGEKDEAKVADKLFSYGIKNVVMKIGTRGCYIRNKDGVMIVPACKGITAVDTIGAGDNFASGFIAALLQGKDIKECGEYANCTAAIAVQHPGATSGVQNRQMVEDMLKKYKEDYK